MHRSILTCAFLVFASAAFAQQQSTQSDPYQGQSSPPSDDVIVATPDQPAQQEAPKAKPRAGKPLVEPQAQGQPQPRTQSQPQPQTSQPQTPQAQAPQDQTPQDRTPQDQNQDESPAPQYSASPEESDAQPAAADWSADSSADADATGTDDGLVGVAKPDGRPALTARGSAEVSDPDGDIVHPHPLQPGQLAYGTTIRVRLLTRLSTVDSQVNEVFRTQVATDVLQDGQVLLPAGAEIDGHVVHVEGGTVRSHGSMLLRPETVILPNGSRFHLDAQVSGTPGSKTHVSSEGFIDPGSRRRRNSMEYGGAVGAGVVTGAMIGGPVGAVTGGIIGAGAVTLHIVSSHSDAILEPGTVLLFTLDNRLDLQAANSPGN